MTLQQKQVSCRPSCPHKDLDRPHSVRQLLLQDGHWQSSMYHFHLTLLQLLLPAELFKACTPRELHIGFDRTRLRLHILLHT